MEKEINNKKDKQTRTTDPWFIYLNCGYLFIFFTNAIAIQYLKFFSLFHNFAKIYKI